jgi:hypothetical protein
LLFGRYYSWNPSLSIRRANFDLVTSESEYCLETGVGRTLYVCIYREYRDLGGKKGRRKELAWLLRN